MKKIYTIAILYPALLSSAAQADWYFRGTANNWGASAMTVTSSTEVTTCQTFGDASTAPRFKIDRLGDWSEAYPSADYSVSPNQSYHISFFTNSHTIAVQNVADCGNSDYTHTFASLNFRGSPNAWGNTAMTLIDDHLWSTNVTFDGQTNQRFKFDVTGDWSQNYGDDNADGVLETSGSDIDTSIVGDYQVTVNDQTLAYTLTATTASNSSSSSTSSVSSVSSSAASSVSSSASSSASNDSWYFRGTPNNWSATAMSPQGSEFCTRQSFAAASNNPRFKIDHYADWTQSYPSADYTATANSTVKICFDPNSHNITLTDLTASSASSADSNQSSSAASSIASTANGDFRSETIYFVLTARFYDGDPSNDYYNRDRYKEGDPTWRGDFKGLIQQLDYIKDLGFTAIWITPPVKNRSGLDYHGYHAYDFYTVDPRLESPDATYQDFIDAAHAKGLKVIQDVVINHSSQYGLRGEVWIDHLPIKYYVPAGGVQGQIVNGPYQGNLGDYKNEFRDDNDNPVAPQWFRERHNSDAAGTVPLVDPKTGVTVPLAGYNANRFFGIDASTLDPNWYHQDGFMAGGDWENPDSLHNKSIAGDCIDLATGRQNVKDYINGAIHKYLDMGVDAIRLDTVKHVERDELLSYVNNWKAYKPGLFVFGEDMVKGTGLGSELANDNASAVIRPWWYTRTTEDPSNPNGGGDSGFSVLDFSVFSTFRDNVTKGSFSGLDGILGWDWIYGDATQLVTFFQNHDVGPDNDFKYRFGGNPAYAAMAYNFLWTNRGIPALYYGEEVQFQAGLPEDVSGANDTLDQTGRAYYGEVLDNPATPDNPLYQHIKRLNQIRAAITALQKAPTTQINDWGAGMSFVRDLSAQNSYAVVGLAAGSSQSITVNTVPNGTYTDAVTGNSITVTSGSINFTVASYSAGIYVLNGPGKIGVDGTYLR